MNYYASQQRAKCRQLIDEVPDEALLDLLDSLRETVAFYRDVEEAKKNEPSGRAHGSPMEEVEG